MRIIYLLSTLMVVGLIQVSCTKDETQTPPDVAANPLQLSWEEYLSLIEDHSGEWNNTDVENTLHSFFEQVLAPVETRTGSIRPSIQSIKKCSLTDKIRLTTKTRSTKGVNELIKDVQIYEVELNDPQQNTYNVILGADKQNMRVLYYGEAPQSDNIQQEAQINLLIQMAYHEQMTTTLKTDSLRRACREQTIRKVCKSLGISASDYSFKKVFAVTETRAMVDSMYNPIGGYSDPLTQTLAFVKPLTKTKWNQQYPYNWEMPEVNPYIDDEEREYHRGRAYVGCANVAVAQLLAAMKVKNVYGVAQGGVVVPIYWDTAIGKDGRLSFNIMNPTSPNNSPIEQIEMVGYLMREIYNKTGSYIKPRSDGEVSFDVETPADKMVLYLQQYLTFEGNYTTKFKKESVMNSLINHSPALIFGFGVIKEPVNHTVILTDFSHCWLIDGYSICKGASDRRAKDLYWSVNLGWTISANRYFYVSSLNPEFSDITHYYDAMDDYVYIDTREQFMLCNFKNK